MADVKVDAAADGSVTYWLQAGDNFKVDESPDIAKHGLDAEIIFNYRPEVDGDSTLLSQGGPQLGELEAGFVANWLCPVFSVVSGGVGCLIATAWVAATTPALRHYHADSGKAATVPARIRSKSPDPV